MKNLFDAIKAFFVKKSMVLNPFDFNLEGLV
jgi:hypothetical protein